MTGELSMGLSLTKFCVCDNFSRALLKETKLKEDEKLGIKCFSSQKADIGKAF